MTSALPSAPSNTRPASEDAFAILASLFVTTLIIAQVISRKHLFLIETPISARSIIYPLTFLFINSAAATYSPQQASIFITQGFSISIIVTILLYVAQQLPTAADSPIAVGDFARVLGPSLGFTLSSLGAYLGGQSFNLYLFSGLIQAPNRRPLWLNSTIASLCAQLVDITLLAILIYVLRSTPENQISIFSNIPSHYALQAIVVLVSTPFVYFTTTWIHRKLPC